MTALALQAKSAAKATCRHSCHMPSANRLAVVRPGNVDILHSQPQHATRAKACVQAFFHSYLRCKKNSTRSRQATQIWTRCATLIC